MIKKIKKLAPIIKLGVTMLGIAIIGITVMVGVSDLIFYYRL
jgi:hypothetical protein